VRKRAILSKGARGRLTRAVPGKVNEKPRQVAEPQVAGKTKFLGESGERKEGGGEWGGGKNDVRKEKGRRNNRSQRVLSSIMVGSK
jgi:hypothetical protein